MDLDLSMVLMEALGPDKAAEAAVVLMQEELGRLSDLELLSDGEWEIVRSRCSLTVELVSRLRQAIAQARLAEQNDQSPAPQPAEPDEPATSANIDIDMSICLIQALGEEKATTTAVVLAREGLYDLALLAKVSDPDWAELRLRAGLNVGQMMRLKREVEAALVAKREAVFQEERQSIDQAQPPPWWSKFTCLSRPAPPGNATRPVSTTPRLKLFPPWGRKSEPAPEVRTQAPSGSADDGLDRFRDVNFEAYATGPPPVATRAASYSSANDGVQEL